MEEQKYVDPADAAHKLCLERFQASDPEAYAEFEKAQADEKQAAKKAQADNKTK